MSDTKIEWADATWNPVFGCTKVSAGCANCYAETMARRLAGMARADLRAGRDPGRKANYLDVIVDGRLARPIAQWNGKLVCDDSALELPLHWHKPRTIFVNSMSDLFHEDVPVEFIVEVFKVMDRCPQHRFMILTKRAEHLANVCLAAPWWASICGAPGTRYKILPHVMLGTSCEDQPTADERIPHLLRCPAAGRFVSCEPLLGSLDLTPYLECTTRDDIAAEATERQHRGDESLSGLEWQSAIDQILIGGESGAGARPCHVEWIRSLVQQAKAAGVACFFKQGGPWLAKQQGWKHPKGGDIGEFPEDLKIRELPCG